MTSCTNASSYMLTSESVTEGHPDKVCDQVSDAILDAMLAQDPSSRVACETAVTKDFLCVIGEVTTHADVPLERIIRDTVRDIGYVGEETGFDPDQTEVRSKHLGLTSMEERAKELGGRLEIRSARGTGTIVTLDLPET